MLQKLFWNDPYAREIQAKIESVEGDCVYLDQTIFYAFSGGQESDVGTIGGIEVLEAMKEVTIYATRSQAGMHFTWVKK